MEEIIKQHAENKKKFEDEKLWGKVGYIVTYANGIAVHTKIISEIDHKSPVNKKKVLPRNQV